MKHQKLLTKLIRDVQRIKTKLSLMDKPAIKKKPSEKREAYAKQFNIQK